MSDQYSSREQRRKQKENSKRGRGKQKGDKGKKSLFKRVLAIILLLGVICFVIGVGTFAYIASTAPELDDAKLTDPVSSVILDKNGKEITELGGEKRELVTYDEIPDKVKNAFIATEDVRFYKHSGIDFYRIGGAAVANVTSGFGAEGASTITQQVIKMSVLTPEKTVTRKVQEMWLALQLERKYSKEEILAMYLNKIDYARSQVFGVKKAAEFFFGKDLDELTLEEAALLAGLPQAPGAYDPYTHPDRAEKRRNTVLNLMAKHGFASKEEVEKAKQVPVTKSLIPIDEQEETDGEYTTFIDEVVKEVKQKTDVDVYSAGLKIHTTLDTDAQDYVDELLSTDNMVNWPDDKFQAGFTVVDTKTGAIRAVGAGRNRVARGLSFATGVNRQPGSTIKPILDYGPAVENLKWSTYHQLKDEPYEYSDGTHIGNYGGNYHGTVSIRKALEQSYNIPALKTFQAVGADKAREFGTNLGLNLPDPITEAYSIGGFSGGVTPTQMAGAYSAFGNNGVYNTPHTVTKVEFPDGNVMNLSPESDSVMHDYTAYMVTDMLKDVVKKGTGKAVSVPNATVAGKTGTTNFSKEDREKYNIPSNASPDAWFVGYSPNYTIAVWTGYENIEKGKYYMDTSQELGMAKQIFSKVMTHVSEDVKDEDFKKPSSVSEVTVEKGSANPGRLASKYTPDSAKVTELFVKGTEPSKVSKTYEKKAEEKEKEEKEEKKEDSDVKKPSGLSASYNKASNQIVLNWNYSGDTDGVSFRVSSTVDGQAGSSTTTNGTSATFEASSPNGNYTFTVVAVNSSGDESDGASTSLRIGTGDGSTGTDEETDNNNQDDQQGTRPEDEQPSEDDSGSDDESNNNNDDTTDEQNNEQPTPTQPTTPPSGNEGNGEGTEGENGGGNTETPTQPETETPTTPTQPETETGTGTETPTTPTQPETAQ
ncbi:PBP1A family penicillin-binding protein [Priestia filamentosa]|uniref:transglycosylase domain-containing protein n=1 Tax=Priestia filamentosa TaxID=1402861 RepID=UPI001FB2278F|nr:PBP1A family penicillin-binding protein [Priestia filamentosa]UOE59632.1 PBP1A family penicillin-binding protein [Priestia filamentosa]